MTTYAILISGDEEAWAKRTEAEQTAVGEAHRAFARSDGRTVRITDGPYAETVDQLGGLYLVESTDLDDLMEVAGELARTERAIEVRPVVGHTGDGP